MPVNINTINFRVYKQQINLPVLNGLQKATVVCCQPFLVFR